LRELYPRWGKEKLCVLLNREGWHTSSSTVGRIKRPFALRKPKNYPVRFPGNLIQIGTLVIRLRTGKHYKHFTARDMMCPKLTIGSALAIVALSWKKSNNDSFSPQSRASGRG